jgi:hypothetical protein
MLAVISSILSSVFGLVVNKVRSTTAGQLENGDITEEKLRDVIIEDLENIKTKIDGLSRAYLLASYSYLKEGIVTLNLALGEAKDKQINKEKVTATTTRKESESKFLNEVIALSHAIQELNNTPNGPLVFATDCFKAAREKATEAFCNEALSLPDRIMAKKLRVASKMLECLQSTKTAAAGCMVFLEQLHNLPAIGRTFSIYFKGGIKSLVDRGSRLENVKSVLALNFAVSEFVARISGELPNVGHWPRIHLSTRETIHPLLLDNDVVKEIFHEEFRPPENQVISDEINWWDCCINSKGLLLSSSKYIKLLSRSEKLKTFCQLRQSTANPKDNPQIVDASAIDRYDNVFVLLSFKGCTRKKYVLFVFDSSGIEQIERVLDFLEYDTRKTTRKSIKCVVNNLGEIILHIQHEYYLYVCDSTGDLKSYLPLEENSSYQSEDRAGDLISVTDHNEIVMRTNKYVLVYTSEGKLKRTIRVKDRTKAVTYNHDTSKIETLVMKESMFGTKSFCILSHSDNDQVELLYLPVHRSIWAARFYSHPAGSAALLYWHDIGEDNKIIFM